MTAETKRLKVIVPTQHKIKVAKMFNGLRHSSVSTEFIWVTENKIPYSLRHQDSVIFTWNFYNQSYLNKIQQEVVDIFTNEYFSDFHILVS
jgi:hypothetical protein